MYTHKAGKMAQLRPMTTWQENRTHLRAYQAPQPIEELDAELEDGSVALGYELTEFDLSIMAAMGEVVTSAELDQFGHELGPRTPSPPCNFFDGHTESQMLDDMGLVENGPPWGLEVPEYNPFAAEQATVFSFEMVTEESSGSQLLAALGPWEPPEKQMVDHLLATNYNPNGNGSWEKDPEQLLYSTAFGQVADVMASHAVEPWRQPGTYVDTTESDFSALFE